MEYYIQTGTGKGHKLSKFSERIRIDIYKHFGTPDQPNGWLNFQARQNSEDTTALLEVAYLMLEDKTDFPTYEVFYEAVTEQKDSMKACVKLYQVVLAAMKNAIPAQLVAEDDAKKKVQKTFLSGIIIGIFSTVLAMYVPRFLDMILKSF